MSLFIYHNIQFNIYSNKMQEELKFIGKFANSSKYLLIPEKKFFFQRVMIRRW